MGDDKLRHLRNYYISSQIEVNSSLNMFSPIDLRSLLYRKLVCKKISVVIPYGYGFFIREKT